MVSARFTLGRGGRTVPAVILAAALAAGAAACSSSGSSSSSRRQTGTASSSTASAHRSSSAASSSASPASTGDGDRGGRDRADHQGHRQHQGGAEPDRGRLGRLHRQRQPAGLLRPHAGAEGRLPRHDRAVQDGDIPARGDRRLRLAEAVERLLHQPAHQQGGAGPDRRQVHQGPDRATRTSPTCRRSAASAGCSASCRRRRAPRTWPPRPPTRGRAPTRSPSQVSPGTSTSPTRPPRCWRSWPSRPPTAA